MPPGDQPAPRAPTRLPRALLGEFLPSPQLLAGRLVASTVAIYTWDCAAYVAFCGYDSTVVLMAETRKVALVPLSTVRLVGWTSMSGGGPIAASAARGRKRQRSKQRVCHGNAFRLLFADSISLKMSHFHAILWQL